MTDFIWVPSKIQSIVLNLSIIILLPVKKNFHFPLLLKLDEKGNPEFQKIVLSAYFIIISMHAKNVIISCQILEEVQ